MYRNTNKYKVIFLLLLTHYFCTGQEPKSKIVDAFNLNIGVTLFKDPFYNNILNNDFPLVSKAGLLGLEFYNEKFNLSLELRKCYWVLLSPSNYQSPVSAIANYDYVGLTKYLKLNSKKSLSIGIGYAFIKENGYRFVSSLNASVPRPVSHINLLPRRSPFNSYTSEALNITLGTNLTQRIFFDIKCNYYTKVFHHFFVTGASLNTVQVSFYIKLNPEKKPK